MEARRQGKLKNLPFISPYNDFEIVAGQGTIGVEIVEQFKKFEPDQGKTRKKKKPDDRSSCLMNQTSTERGLARKLGIEPSTFWSSVCKELLEPNWTCQDQRTHQILSNELHTM